MNDIFTNQKDVVENLRESASALGINPDTVASNTTDAVGPRFYAKSNCKWCFGRGTLAFVANPEGVNTRVREQGKFKIENRINSLCKCVRVVNDSKA